MDSVVSHIKRRRTKLPDPKKSRKRWFWRLLYLQCSSLGLLLMWVSSQTPGPYHSSKHHVSVEKDLMGLNWVRCAPPHLDQSPVEGRVTWYKLHIEGSPSLLYGGISRRRVSLCELSSHPGNISWMYCIQMVTIEIYFFALLHACLSVVLHKSISLSYQAKWTQILSYYLISSPRVLDCLGAFFLHLKFFGCHFLTFNFFIYILHLIWFIF